MYSKMTATVALAALALGLSVAVRGGDEKEVPRGKLGTKEIKTTGKEVESAVKVDFNKALGLTFESLEEMGGQDRAGPQGAGPGDAGWPGQRAGGGGKSLREEGLAHRRDPV